MTVKVHSALPDFPQSTGHWCSFLLFLLHDCSWALIACHCFIKTKENTKGSMVPPTRLPLNIVGS